jgi:hypothetical protein
VVLGMAVMAMVAGCGTSRGAGGGGGQGGLGPSDSRVPGDDVHGDEPTPADGGDAGPSTWPVLLQLMNVGNKDILLASVGAVTCGFSISVAVPGSTTSHLTSITPPDSWCACDRCGANGRRLCDSNDPICDGSPVTLRVGEHLDYQWDGRIAVVQAMPPAGSACPFVCDHWETVPPGTYVFSVMTLSGSELLSTATLPSATNILQLSLDAG